jgi:putative addiction module component (TIGR02574 family)
MSPDLKECEAQAMRLPPEDRAALAELLIASLDTLDDAENERLWLKESERRYQEYKRGNISARPAEDVLRDARSAIK